MGHTGLALLFLYVLLVTEEAIVRFPPSISSGPILPIAAHNLPVANASAPALQGLRGPEAYVFAPETDAMRIQINVDVAEHEIDLATELLSVLR